VTGVPRRADLRGLVRTALALPPPDTPHDARPGLWCAPVVLVDGRSGSGKTVLADRLAEVLRGAGRAGPGVGWRGVQVAHLDSWYPGWGGLEAGTRLTEDLLTRTPAVPEWDWTTDRVRRWVALDPRRPLIVEGAGALTARTRSAANAMSRLRAVIWAHPSRKRHSR